MVGFRLSILYHRSLPNRSAYFMHPCFVPDNSILESDFRTYPTRFSGIPLTCRELRGYRKYNLCRSQRGRPFFRYPSPRDTDGILLAPELSRAIPGPAPAPREGPCTAPNAPPRVRRTHRDSKSAHEAVASTLIMPVKATRKPQERLYL